MDIGGLAVRSVWWGEAPDEPAREDARPTGSCKLTHYRGPESNPQITPDREESESCSTDRVIRAGMAARAPKEVNRCPLENRLAGDLGQRVVALDEFLRDGAGL